MDAERVLVATGGPVIVTATYELTPPDVDAEQVDNTETVP